ncbi:MAG TPA: hypothetical protein VKV16_03380 [Solirubrobacteraceae bacterium]|nr:hypothetical protein [Solirubrobacteraceae bacterium]
MSAPAEREPGAGGGAPAVTVVLRPLGSPLTVGLSGLGIASLVESGLALGWVPSTQARGVGVVLISVPFVLQLLACVFSYLARDGAAGAAVGVLSTTWLGTGVLHVIGGAGTRSGPLGLLLLAAAFAIAVSATSVSAANSLAGAVFFLAAVRFCLAGVYNVGGATAWNHAAGVVGLLVSATVAYAVLAFELEGQRRRALLPTFRRGHGLSPARIDPREQLDTLAHEPGVRQTS